MKRKKQISVLFNKIKGFFMRDGAIVSWWNFFVTPRKFFGNKKLLKGNLYKFFLEKVVRGNVVQFCSNFPAKSN